MNPANWRVAKAIFVADDLAKAKEYALGPNNPTSFINNFLLNLLLWEKSGYLKLT